MSDLTKRVTEERLAFLTLAKQLATPSEVSGSWREGTFVTAEGPLKGEFAGLSTDERCLRVAKLESAVGTYRQASLRDTDVLVARFELGQEEIAEIRAARSSISTTTTPTAQAAAAPAADVVAAAPVPQKEPYDNIGDEDSDDGCDAIGFMFDAEQSKSERAFTFPVEREKSDDQQDSKDLHVRLLCIDDNPGAVQSGHYIWPAATALAEHLAAHWTEVLKGLQGSTSTPKLKVLELGAGCGLAGIAAAHLAAASSSVGEATVVFTDHDPKTIELIRDNLNLQAFPKRGEPPLQAAAAAALAAETAETTGTESGAEAGKGESSTWSLKASGLRLLACDLKWGKTHHSAWPDELVQEMRSGGDSCGDSGFDLLLCSDVIYDRGVVEPLLWTIRQLLRPSSTRVPVLSLGEDERSRDNEVGTCTGQRGDTEPATTLGDARQQQRGGSKCFLCASFALEAGTDELVERLCSQFGLSCNLLFDHLASTPSGCRLHVLSLLENE